jgi:hypothetical protein
MDSYRVREVPIEHRTCWSSWSSVAPISQSKALEAMTRIWPSSSIRYQLLGKGRRRWESSRTSRTVPTRAGSIVPGYWERITRSSSSEPVMKK